MAKKERAKGVPCPADCGALLVNLPANTGSVCPGGCGKIQPVLTSEQNGAGLRRLRMAKLLVCTALTAIVAASPIKFMGRLVYRIEGHLSLWRRVKRLGGGLSKPTVEGAVLCWWKAADKAVELLPFQEANMQVAGMGLLYDGPSETEAAGEGPDDAE